MTDNQTKDIQQNSTDKQLFRPSAKQEKWLDTAISLETDEITKIAEECEIDRTTWYHWLKTPGFIDWFNAEWDKRLKGHAWKLDAIGMKNAKRDFNYWKGMMQRAGKMQEGGNTNIQVNVTPILGGATKEKLHSD